jgi:hypothetical protein
MTLLHGNRTISAKSVGPALREAAGQDEGAQQVMQLGIFKRKQHGLSS